MRVLAIAEIKRKDRAHSVRNWCQTHLNDEQGALFWKGGVAVKK